MGRNSVSPSMTVARSAPSRRSHGQSGVPKRSARSGQVSGKKWECRSTTVTAGPVAGAQRGRGVGRAVRPYQGGPNRSSGRCEPPRRRRTRRRPQEDRRPGSRAAPRRDAPARSSAGSTTRTPSTMPAGRWRSMTSPTDPGTGRCGEWRTWAGSRNTSPSRIGMSRGAPSSQMRRTMSPRSWWKNSSHGSSWKSVRWLGPPTTVTMKSPSAQIWALPTGGRSRSRCSSIQDERLIGSTLSPSGRPDGRRRP